MNRWREVDSLGAPPSLRHGHSVCTWGGLIVVFGGTPDGSSGFNDIFFYDPEQNKWSEPKVSGQLPPGRYRHSATVVKDRMYVFGGYRSRAFDDLWFFDFGTLTWSAVVNAVGTPPSPRSSHSACTLGDNIFVFGGSGQRYSNELFVFDTAAATWQKIETDNVPTERWCHSAVMFGTKMVIFGGARNKRSNNETHVLDLESLKWTVVGTQGSVPSARQLHTALAVGHHMLIFGGWESRRELNDLYAFDLKTLEWEALITDGAVPAARQLHGSAFVKGEMFVFGGYAKTTRMNDIYALTCEYSVSSLRDLCIKSIVDDYRNLPDLLKNLDALSEELWMLLLKRAVQIRRLNPASLEIFLKKVPHLRELSLAMAGDVVTDKWLELIACSTVLCASLEALDLTNCHLITHVGLAHLKNLPRLQVIQVDHKNQISEDYMYTLLRMLPGLRISKAVEAQ